MVDFGKVSSGEAEVPQGMTVQVGRVEVARPDPFDLVSAKARFGQFQKQIDLLADEVERFSVENDDDAARLTVILGDASRLVKDLDKLQKRITDPHYSFYKKILGFKNSFTDKIDFIIREGKKTLSDYSYKKELARREAEKKAQDEVRKRQEELDRIAEEKEIEKVVLEPAIIEEKKSPIRTESGTASTRIDWTFEVVDLEEVPRQYLRVEVDKRSVNEAIRSGIREISGLRIFEISKVSIRTN